MFTTRFGEGALRRIHAHMLSYGALHLVLGGRRRAGMRWLLRAWAESRSTCFTRRTAAILTRLVLGAPGGPPPCGAALA